MAPFSFGYIAPLKPAKFGKNYQGRLLACAQLLSLGRCAVRFAQNGNADLVSVVVLPQTLGPDRKRKLPVAWPVAILSQVAPDNALFIAHRKLESHIQRAIQQAMTPWCRSGGFRVVVYENNGRTVPGQ